MVTIINYKKRTSTDGKEFFVLVVQGGIEMVKSQSTEKFYATAKKAQITSTFDECTCSALIGTEMPGKIVRQECPAYEYTVKETGEVIELTHEYAYVSEQEASKMNDSAQLISQLEQAGNSVDSSKRLEAAAFN